MTMSPPSKCSGPALPVPYRAATYIAAHSAGSAYLKFSSGSPSMASRIF
jgi:hypothetical protein